MKGQQIFRRAVARDLNKRWDPKRYLIRMSPQIEKIIGVPIGNEKIDELSITYRLVRLQLLLKSKMFVPKLDPNFRGMLLGEKTIFLNLEKIAEDIIGCSGTVKQDDDTKKQLIWLIEKELNKILIHEFVHYIHRSERPEDFLTLKDALKETFSKIFLPNSKIEIEICNENIAKVITSELIAIGTTSILFEENRDTLDHLLIMLIDSKIRDMEIDEFRQWMLNNNPLKMRYELANRFLMYMMPIYGEKIVKQLLERPPSFQEIVRPQKYLF